jgi:hypothetical protein
MEDIVRYLKYLSFTFKYFIFRLCILFIVHESHHKSTRMIFINVQSMFI